MENKLQHPQPKEVSYSNETSHFWLYSILMVLLLIASFTRSTTTLADISNASVIPSFKVSEDFIQFTSFCIFCISSFFLTSIKYRAGRLNTVFLLIVIALLFNPFYRLDFSVEYRRIMAFFLSILIGYLNFKESGEPYENKNVNIEKKSEIKREVIEDLSTSQVNTSGQGENARIPKEIQKWNWGASLLWIWGFAHGLTVLTILAFITTKIFPFAGIVWAIIFGIKGNEWAWRNKKYESVNQFFKKQAVWRNWGIGLLSFAIVMLLIFLATPFFY